MLAKRIITSIFGIIFIGLILFLDGWFFVISVLLFAWLCMHEFYTAFNNIKYKPQKWLGYTLIALVFYFLFMHNEDMVTIVIPIGVLAGLTVPIFFQSINPLDISITTLGFVYPGLAFGFVIFLKRYISPAGDYLLIYTFIATWSADIFAYFIGTKFGKRKLCPNISPKKTVEGSFGALLGSVLISFFTGWILNRIYGNPIPIYHYIFMGFLAGIFAQLGDISASVIKRYCDIKDFGHIMPGHGGMLDRLDSFLFTAPVIYLYYLVALVS